MAALAVTSSNSNSFSTSAAFYTIGGIGVSGFTNMAQSFGSNNSPGASSASDTFTVTQPSLVVVVAMAGGQSYLTLSGVPNLQVDAQVGSQIGGVIGMVIAHASLSPGTYTATENSFPSPAPGQDPNHMADLIGVFVFSGPPHSVNLETACVNGLQVDINGGAAPGPSVTSISWNWGDGTATTGFFPESHTYSSLGTYTIQVTAHYNNGTTASASQFVAVAPKLLSSCVALAITAGQGGSVSYQASVGSGTVTAGSSKILELAFADDLSLTENPSSGDSFSNWSPSSGITFLTGNTTSPSVEIVVANASTMNANFGVGGIQNTITLKDYTAGSNAGCPSPFTGSCFSIQQNLLIEEPTSTTIYWAQNAVIIQNIRGVTLAYGEYNLYKYPNLQSPIECYPGSVTSCGSPNSPVPFFSWPPTWTLTTEIDSNNHLVMTNPFFGPPTLTRTLNTATSPHSLIALGNVPPVQNATPELIFVGYGNRAQTSFGSSTSGGVETWLEMSDSSWSSSVALIPHQPSDSLSAETSSGLQWTFGGSNTANFGAPGVPAEGIGFVPSTPIAQATLQSGQAGIDEISSTGVSVTITGSSARDGTQVTIATANEGANQPPGTGQLNLGAAGFYDVNITLQNAFPDGTATVCISSPAVKSQTVMQYWNNGSYSWIGATNLKPSSNPPNTICGDIPVAALSGTQIAVGPLESGKPPKVDLDTTVRSLTRSRRTHRHAVVLDITNSGSIVANDVKVTLSELNGTATSTELPVSLGDLSYAASASVTLAFPAREKDEADDDEGLLRIIETYTGGSAEQVVRVKLPHRDDSDDDDGGRDDHK